MRILLLTQYFPPETGAAQNRLSDLAQRLSVAGHEITVLTSMPNYPQARIFEGYRGRVFCRETADRVRILRTWCYVGQSRGFVSRLLNYCSFALLAFICAVLAGGKQDVIVVESPPIFLGITGLLLSWWRHAPMIFNVSDLWPQSAVAMGLLRNRILVTLASTIEKCIYKKSYAITGQTEGIVQYIKSCTSSVPVELVTNGVDPERFISESRQRMSTRTQLGLVGNAFVVGYAGLHGLAQGLDTLLEAAKILQSENARIVIAFFGDGPDKTNLQQRAIANRLTNVLFFPPQPAEDMPRILGALDAAVVPLRNTTLFSGALPSKLFECMAAKLPIVVSIPEGEATRLVKAAVGGLCIPPEDPYAMAEAIARLATDRDLCTALGENAHRYVCLHYDRREMARRFLKLLPSDPVWATETLEPASSSLIQEQNLEEPTLRDR